jgi:hypothetical protein
MRIDQDVYLKDLHAKLESQLRKISELADHEETLLGQKRQDGGWSAAECLHHLHLTYELYRPRIDTIVPNLALNSNGMFKSSWMGRMSVKNTGPDAKQRIKMKMKTFDFFEPQDGISFSDARMLLEADLVWQKEVMTVCLDKNICTPKVQSAVKWMKFRLGDAFAFILAHNERHLLQAENNINHL